MDSELATIFVLYFIGAILVFVGIWYKDHRYTTQFAQMFKQQFVSHYPEALFLYQDPLLSLRMPELHLVLETRIEKAKEDDPLLVFYTYHPKIKLRNCIDADNWEEICTEIDTKFDDLMINYHDQLRLEGALNDFSSHILVEMDIASHRRKKVIELLWDLFTMFYESALSLQVEVAVQPN